jgi:hypothetical protein
VLLVVLIGAVIAGISFVGARLYHMRTAAEGPATPVPGEPPPES